MSKNVLLKLLMCTSVLVVGLVFGRMYTKASIVSDSNASTQAVSGQQRNSGRQKTEKVTKNTIENADISILFIGNSHASPIPRYLTSIFASESPQSKTLFARAKQSGFLISHAHSKSTVALLKKGKWDYVVFQAQKYSSSGRYSYPHDGALALSEIANNQGTKIIMYPEWSRRGVQDEYLRINKIHEMIAEKTGAGVAPIGQTWELALKELTDQDLYAADGNHASGLGSYLNACVFYSMVTGKRVGKPVDPSSNNTSLSRLLGKSKDSKQFKQRVVEDAAWDLVNAMPKSQIAD